MLKDDRMMSMLTFAVIMVAVGTLIQRVDVVEWLFGGGKTALRFQRDEAIVRPNALSGIDVLANDLGIREGDAENLFIVAQPACGRAFVRDGKVQYLPAESCAGTQTFRYALSGRRNGQAGEVIVVVRLGEPTQSAVAADAQRDIPAPAPLAPRAAEQRVAETPALLAAQPSAGGDAGGAIVPVPTVPRPQAPAIAGLPDAAPAAGSAVAGVTLDGSGPAPRMAAPAGGLGDAPEIAAVPVVPQPDPEAAAQPAPAAPAATEPEGEATATIALARIDPVALATGAAAGPSIQRENDGLDARVPRAGLPEIGSGGSGPAGLGQPADALAAVRALGDAIELAPVDTTPPAPLSGFGATTGAGAPQTGFQSPQTPAVPCEVPPALILEVRPAGLTEVIIESPCHAGTVAELSYDGLSFGVALDGAGAGTVAAVGFQQASDAVMRFSGGETIDFNIPFADTERMARVALAWELPVELDLHAFEFGALARSDGHVRPDRPRSFGDVRRRGGGYLLEYQPVGGIGQSISVYTYWRRYGGRSGVVKLGVDFASRDGRQRPDTCGGGALAEPDFTVLRSMAGKLERPRHRRLASLDCAAIAGTTDLYIGDAVDDMIVLQR